MSHSIDPAPIHLPQARLDELARRLELTRWPDREIVPDWSHGVPLAALQELCRHWRHEYDWRRCERMLNSWNPHRTVIDGLGVHFCHIRSPEPDALPVIMTHGWPGSVIEFHRTIGPLTNPRAFGGDPADAVHLVLPSLPGFAFSDKPRTSGWGVDRIADAWIELMRRLGYADRWAAQGGDWGGAVTLAIGSRSPKGCIGVHLNICWIDPSEAETLEADFLEQGILARKKRHRKEFLGFAIEQATRPQTIGYLLADSPVGQAAWIYEKFMDWTDTTGAPEAILTRDEMLDNIMLYWLTNSGASSARLYAESRAQLGNIRDIAIPMAFSMFPKEMSRSSQRWARRRYPSIVYWGEPDRGGHFAAFEQPGLFVDEVRNAMRELKRQA